MKYLGIMCGGHCVSHSAIVMCSFWRYCDTKAVGYFVNGIRFSLGT